MIEEALVLYQTSLRKPSFTVFLLDVSGSMEGEGLTDLKQAMTGILDQKLAGRYFLQASGRDVMAVVPFNKQPFSPSIFQGNTPEAMQKALSMVNGLTAGGGTNIYAPVIQAFKIFGQAGQEINRYLPAVILMTDGQSQDGSLNDIKTFWQSMKADFDLPPVFAVTFGQADETQLKEIAHFTVGRIFDGRKGLKKAFRQAKGYN